MHDNLFQIFTHFDSWLDDIILNEIIPFLDEDADAIITIDLETLGDRELIMRKLREILQQTVGFTDRIFRIEDERWSNHSEWPKIQELRDADQRVIIFSDNSIVHSSDYGIMLRSNIVMENMWGSLDGCTPRNAYIAEWDVPWAPRHITETENRKRKWTRLFTMNHFCCDTGIESLTRVKPENIGGGDNGWGILYPRVMMCMAENGHMMKPNFIAVDWAHIGDANEVADYLNFGGRLGTGQRCQSGLDCATGACSVSQHCHCQICGSARPGCSGCDVGESCVKIVESGVHECTSNVSGMAHTDTGTDSPKATAAIFSRRPALVIKHTLMIISFLLHGMN